MNTARSLVAGAITLAVALGGLFVGVVGYLVPRLTYPGVDVFGPGYEVINNMLMVTSSGTAVSLG